MIIVLWRRFLSCDLWVLSMQINSFNTMIKCPLHGLALPQRDEPVYAVEKSI